MNQMDTISKIYLAGIFATVLFFAAPIILGLVFSLIEEIRDFLYERKIRTRCTSRCASGTCGKHCSHSQTTSSTSHSSENSRTLQE